MLYAGYGTQSDGGLDVRVLQTSTAPGGAAAGVPGVCDDAEVRGSRRLGRDGKVLMSLRWATIEIKI